MKTTLIVIIAILIGLRYLVPWLVRINNVQKPELKSRPELDAKPAKLSKDLYESTPKNEREELLYDFIYKIRLADNFGTGSIKNMPDALRAVHFVNALEAEVNNGGFLQFFTNSSGQYTKETLETLALIGATHNKALMEKALQILIKHHQSPEELNEKINNKRLYQFFQSSDFYENDLLLEEMHKVDQEFYEYKEDISKLKMDFFEAGGEELWDEMAKKYGN